MNERKPWHLAAKENCLERMELTMTHDELVELIGRPAYRCITEAGFVLVPRKWRNDVQEALCWKNNS